MPLAATLLASNYDNVDRASYPTVSITPAANSLLIVGQFITATTNAGTPTVSDALSGGALTWTTINFDLDGGRSQGVFRAQCGATPGSGTLTISGTGGDGTWTGAGWFVVQFTGHNTAAPVPQFGFVGGDGTTSAAPTGTLGSAIGNAGNRVIVFVSHRTSEATGPRASWTELGDFNFGTPAMGWECQWRNDGTNETTYGCTFPTASRYQMHAVEIAVATGAAAGRPKVWTGAAFVAKPAKVWTGAAWVEKPVKVWTGSAWKTVT